MAVQSKEESACDQRKEQDQGGYDGDAGHADSAIGAMRRGLLQGNLIEVHGSIMLSLQQVIFHDAGAEAGFNRVELLYDLR